MKKLFLPLTVLLVLGSCVTINIYFPAEEVKQAADKIVTEVWGEQGKAKPAAATGKPVSRLLEFFSPESAYAEQDINVSTPQIRAIKAAIQTRAGELQRFMNSGHVGIGKDGMLKIRNIDGLDLKDRAAVKRLTDAENKDRKQLYEEIAKANGFPQKVKEVQDIFADSWRSKAAAGWYLEKSDGSWEKK